MSTTIFFNNLQKHLFRYADLVEHSNSLGLSNEAVDAEDLFCVFLNKAFRWNLINANASKKNQETFDLIDAKKGIVVQVTSNKNHSAKLKATVASFKAKSKKVKLKRLIVLFISRKCTPVILKEVKTSEFVYEGYDIPKLLTKLKYKNKLPAQLRTLNEIIEQATAPVLLNSTYPTINNPESKVVLPAQTITRNKKGIYIDRRALVENVFSFAQIANGLIVGGPGVGKSFTIEELQKHCSAKKVPCYIIRINELLEGTDDELKKELKTNSNWINALKKTLSENKEFKGLLIFDAFDTAKDEKLKSAILKQIKEAINELKGKWNVLVSARTFDAAKSTRLLDLFSETNITMPISCRYFEIPELSEDEFTLASKSNKKYLFIVQRSTAELKALLKIPYFFKLLEKVILQGSGFKADDLIHIETEEQLLEIYWKTKVANDTVKDVFLRALTQKLILNESLSCSKESILTESNTGIYDDLISSGILAESSATKQNISFSHNILLEFAVAKYLIPEDINRLFSYINDYKKIPFLFRQSFVYFYSKLWKEDNALFWKHYFQVRNNDTPLYRLYHQTILNYILAGYYKTPKNLLPVFNLTDLQERGNTIRKILEGIRFTSKGKLRDKDFLLFLEISRYMHEIFLWEFGFLIDKAIKAIVEKPNQKFHQAISKAALNYLDFILKERKISSNNLLIEANGGMWGIENVCAVFSTNKQVASKQIKQILAVIKEPDFPIRFFYTLSDKFLTIFKSDKKLGILIYATLYNHVENSDKETYLGNSVVMSLRSNRRQDFESIHHKLEQDYKELLSLDPETAIPLGLNIANKFSLGKKHYRPSDRQFNININGIKAKLLSDFSFYDSEHDKQYGPMSHAENIFKYLEQQIADGKSKYAQKLINIIFSKSEATIIWRRLFKLFTKYPTIFTKQAVGLLYNKEIFICEETVYEAGELIKVLWDYLSGNQKRMIEKNIISLATSKLLKEDSEFAARRIRRLLSCIPKEELLLPASVEFMGKNKPVENEPLVKYSGLQPYHSTEEEKIRDMGVDSTNATELAAYNLIKLVEPFNAKYDYNNSDKPILSEYEPLIPTIKELFELNKSQKSFNEKLQFNCDYEVSRFAKLVARNATKLKKSTRLFISEIANYYIEKTSYKSIDYQSGSFKDRGVAYSPTPRTAATQTFVQLLYTDKSGIISPLVLQLVSDNISIVRFKALHAITFYWHHQRVEFWEIIKRRSALEKDGLSLHRLISSICYDNIIKENQDEVEKTALILVESLKDSDDDATHEIWHTYVVLLLKLVIKYNSKVATGIIYSNFSIKEFSRQLLFEIIRNVIPPGTDNNYITNPEKYSNLIDIIHAIAAFRFNSIKTKGLKSDNLRDDFEIIDGIIQKLFFSFTDGKNTNKSKVATTFANKIAFFNKIKPLLSFIVDESNQIDSGFMVAHTGYYFMQLLNSMLHADAEYVLTISASIVKCATANGFTYDQSTLGEVVKLSEKILADHKELLSNKEHFDSLITMLDLFANSGWQEALELTWRLKEVF